MINVCYEQTSRFWTTLLQPGYRISDLTQRLARLQPRTGAAWRFSGADEDFRAFHAEFIRRLPNESSLRTTAKPWFVHQLRMIAHTIEAATAPDADNSGLS